MCGGRIRSSNKARGVLNIVLGWLQESAADIESCLRRFRIGSEDEAPPWACAEVPR